MTLNITHRLHPTHHPHPPKKVALKKLIFLRIYHDKMMVSIKYLCLLALKNGKAMTTQTAKEARPLPEIT